MPEHDKSAEMHTMAFIVNVMQSKVVFKKLE